MKTINFALLSLVSFASAGPLDKRAASPSDICVIGKTQGSTCNKPGTLATPKVLRSQYANDQQACVDAIHLAPKAQSASFTFQGEGGNCTLYSATLAAQGYKQGPSPNSKYFDKACLQCQPCKLGFTNGNFETGNLSPWGTISYPFAGNEFSIKQPGYKGSKYAAGAVISQAGQPGNMVSVLYTSVLTQDYQLCLGTTYLVKAFIKGSFTSDSESVPHSVRMYMNGEQGSAASAYADSFPANYFQLNFTYTATDHFDELVFSQSMSVTRSMNATFSLLVDSVTVTPQ